MHSLGYAEEKGLDLKRRNQSNMKTSMKRKLPKRKANRMKGYDYSQDNLYFVTSCVRNMICCFGKIESNEMILNEYGKIAYRQWYWLSEQYPYVRLHEFVVMPNHIHGIIEINRNGRPVPVRTGLDLSVRIKSLSQLMGAYKTTTSKQIHLLGYESFAWQRSFHDHIIRNQNAFIAISNYISDNPSKWKSDKCTDGS